MAAQNAPAWLLHTACVLCAAAVAGCSGSAGVDKSTGPGTTPEPSSQDASRPQHDYNVLLVTLDTTRADYLGCYDAAHAELTPNLDALAADAVRFEFAIAQASATPVSHASILTGLNPYEHGVRVISADAGYKLSPEIPTLTTVLKGHGWATGAFLSSFTVSEYYGFDYGFDTFDSGLQRDVSRPFVRDRDGYARWPVGTGQRRSDATTDRALAWLAATKDRPFFLWVHYWDPHDWLVLPPPAERAA